MKFKNSYRFDFTKNLPMFLKQNNHFQIVSKLRDFIRSLQLTVFKFQCFKRSIQRKKGRKFPKKEKSVEEANTSKRKENDRKTRRSKKKLRRENLDDNDRSIIFSPFFKGIFDEENSFIFRKGLSASEVDSFLGDINKRKKRRK